MKVSSFQMNCIASLVIIFIAFISISNCEKNGDEFVSLLRQLDILAIEQAEAPGSKWSENLEKLKEITKSLSSTVTKSLKDAGHKVATFYKGVKKSVKDTIEDRIAKNMHREKAHLEEMEQIWLEIWKGLKGVISSTSQAAKNEMVAAKNRVQQVMQSLEKDAGPTLKDRWVAIGKELATEVESLENFLGAELQLIEDRFTKLLQIIQAHISRQTERPHHVLLRCRECDGDIHFEEFLDMIDPKHIMSLPPHEHYNDGSLEEYYEGWAEWANRMGIKCLHCDSFDKWEAKVIYDDDKSKTKDEL